MNRYRIDKVLREIVLNHECAQAFRADPGAYLENRELSAVERTALEKVDFRTLYAAGAHPFLLSGFVMSVWSGDRRTLQGEYRASLSPLGYPDFSS